MLVSRIANSTAGNGPLSRSVFSPYAGDWDTKRLIEELVLYRNNA